MRKLLEADILKKHLIKYFGHLDLTDKANQKFIEGMTGAILMIIPETIAHMIEQGKEPDEGVVFAAMAAVGGAVSEVGQTNLKEKGYENDNHGNVVGFIGKLQH